MIGVDAANSARAVLGEYQEWGLAGQYIGCSPACRVEQAAFDCEDRRELELELEPEQYDLETAPAAVATVVEPVAPAQKKATTGEVHIGAAAKLNVMDSMGSEVS